MLTRDATLVDIAFAVCTALYRVNERALLVGGSAATYYAPEADKSNDCDFVLSFGANATHIVEALDTLGYRRTGAGIFCHPEIIMTVEFPPGPAAIGIDLIERYSEVRRADELLYIYTPTDVVRDRLLHYWAWGDFTALRVAIDVAKAQCEQVDFDAIRDWTNREIKEAPAAYDSVRRDLFLEDIRVALR
jgi:hypothetical protein